MQRTDDRKSKHYILLLMRGLNPGEAMTTLERGDIARSHPDVWALSNKHDYTFTEAIREGVEELISSGKTESAAANQIGRWFKQTKLCSAQNVNKALRSVGIRARAERSDKGCKLSSTGILSAIPKHDEKNTSPEKLADYIWDLCDDDQIKRLNSLPRHSFSY